MEGSLAFGTTGCIADCRWPPKSIRRLDLENLAASVFVNTVQWGSPNPKCQDILDFIEQEVKIECPWYFTNTIIYKDKLHTMYLFVYGRYEFCCI